MLSKGESRFGDCQNPDPDRRTFIFALLGLTFINTSNLMPSANAQNPNSTRPVNVNQGNQQPSPDVALRTNLNDSPIPIFPGLEASNFDFLDPVFAAIKKGLARWGNYSLNSYAIFPAIATGIWKSNFMWFLGVGGVGTAVQAGLALKGISLPLVPFQVGPWQDPLIGGLICGAVGYVAREVLHRVKTLPRELG